MFFSFNDEFLVNVEVVVSDIYVIKFCDFVVFSFSKRYLFYFCDYELNVCYSLCKRFIFV